MSQGGVEEPFTIAAIPKPLNEEHGRIRATPVYSLNASRKRKRHEVIVSVDGESANIYNVQTQMIISSYALPPQTYIAAPPCSIYTRNSTLRQSERRTYLVTRDAPRDTRQRLVSMIESSKTKNGEPKAILKREHKLRAGNVVAVEVLQPSSSSSATAATSGIMVAYNNGSVDYVSDDLSSTVWEHTAPAERPISVEFSVVIDSATAAKGLLKNRDDVLAAVGNFGTGNSALNQAPILCQVVRTKGNLELRCYSIRRQNKESLRLPGPALTEVMKYALPEGKQGTAYELHAASGMLYEHHAQTLRVSDITGPTPKVVIELSKKVTPVHRFVRISASCLFIVSDRAAIIYETKFGSILGSLQLSREYMQEENAEPGPGQAVSASRQLDPISSLPDLGLIVAISGNDLVAFQISEATSTIKRKRVQGPVLADVLGKGDRIAGTGTMKNAASQAKFEEWRNKVDRLIFVEDIEALEALVAKDLRIKIPLQHGNVTGNGLTNGHANGHVDEVPKLWELSPSTYDPSHVDTRKATYLLTKMFTWRSTTKEDLSNTCRLEITFKSRNILRWLARIGYLNSLHIEREIPVPVERDGSRLRVQAGNIMSAVEQIDQGFLLTCDLMSIPVHWDLAEVMQGLRLLIQSLEDPALPLEEDVTMTDADFESKIEEEEAAANRELQRLVSVVEDGPLQRSEALRKLIARLQGFPKRDIKKAMRSILSQTQLVFLLRVLQVELHEGGWTSLYVRTDQDEIEQDQVEGLEDAQIIPDTSHNICTITNLLDCTIDAIGTSGWLVGLSSERELSDVLIQRLRMQISAAVTGCLEANNVDMYLNELCRTAAQAQRAGKRKRGAKLESVDLSAEDIMLPLGGNLVPPRLKSRNKRKQQSAASERVGEYTFERLRW